MLRDPIIARSARFVTSLLSSQSLDWSHYHNFQHTLSTVAACRKIGRAEGLKTDDLEIVTVAGWFHDTGYTVSANQHEETSAAIALEFLTKEGCPAKKIEKILDCIMATKVPQRPRDLREKVICDADMVSLGQKTFLAQNELLRQEISARENRTIDLVAWLRRTDLFLKDHRFHTAYGSTVLERGRQRNLAAIRRLLGSNEPMNATRTSRKRIRRK